MNSSASESLAVTSELPSILQTTVPVEEAASKIAEGFQVKYNIQVELPNSTEATNSLPSDAEAQPEVPRYLGFRSKEEEEAFLVYKKTGNPHARNIIVMANQPLVTGFAKRYQNNVLSMGDLENEGNLGLMHAIDLYDAGLHFTLATYAKTWIFRFMQIAMQRQRLINIPQHAHEQCRSIRKELAQCTSEVQRKQAIELSLASLTQEQADAIRGTLSREQLSIHPTRPGDEELELPEPAYEGDELDDLDDRLHPVIEAFKSMSFMEQTVLNLRFGLGLKIEQILLQDGRTAVRYAFNPELYGKRMKFQDMPPLFPLVNGKELTHQRVQQIAESALVRLVNTEHPNRHGLALAAHVPEDEIKEIAHPLLDSGFDPRFNITLAELGLDVRAINLLEQQRLYTVGDWVALTKDEKESIPRFAEKCIVDLEARIRQLGIDPADWNMEPGLDPALAVPGKKKRNWKRRTAG